MDQISKLLLFIYIYIYIYTRIHGPFGATLLALVEGFLGPSALLRGLQPSFEGLWSYQRLNYSDDLVFRFSIKSTSF